MQMWVGWRATRTSASLPSDAELGELATTWLDGRAGFLGFPPALERRFEHDTEAARRRSLRIVTFVCMLVYIGYLPIYALMLPHEAGRFAAAQFGVALPFIFGALALMGRPRGKMVREGVFAAVSLICLLAITWAYQGSQAGIAPNMRYSPILALLYCNAILGLRFPYAVCATVLMVATNIADCMHAAISPDFRLHAWTTVAYVGVFSLLGTWRLEREARRTYLLTLRETMRGNALGDANRQLRVLSVLDPLTGLVNRRGLEAALGAAWDAARDSPSPISLLMIDVDCFKLYNDRLGHPAGDECLRRVASALHAELRLGQDTLARYGGEEFVAIVRSADMAVALALAERMRRAVEDMALPHPGGSGSHIVTVSIGCASAANTADTGAGALLEAADKALYHAKQTGRNRVCLASGRAGLAACA